MRCADFRRWIHTKGKEPCYINQSISIWEGKIAPPSESRSCTLSKRMAATEMDATAATTTVAAAGPPPAIPGERPSIAAFSLPLSVFDWRGFGGDSCAPREVGGLARVWEDSCAPREVRGRSSEHLAQGLLALERRVSGGPHLARSTGLRKRSSSLARAFMAGATNWRYWVD